MGLWHKVQLQQLHPAMNFFIFVNCTHFLSVFVLAFSSVMSGRDWVEGIWEGESFVPLRATKCEFLCRGNLTFSDLSTRQRLKVYDSETAFNCLSSKKYEQIIVVGDSYMRNMYEGILTILIEDRGYVSEIPLESLNKETRYMEAIVSGIKVTYIAQFGLNSPLPLRFSSLDNSSNLVIYGSMVHDHKFRQVDMLIRKSVKDRARIRLLTKNIEHPGRTKYKRRAHRAWLKKLSELKFSHASFFWLTSPFYETVKLENINHFAAVNQNNDQYLRWNIAGVNELLKADMKTRFIDAFHLTKSCVYANCSKDGAHRSLFVNKMKFQVLLNILCIE